jgi:CRP/FNR family cyclic AMP-dependent transcriptional regulator
MKRVLFILGVLEDEDVDWLINTGRRQSPQPGDIFIQEGQPSEEILFDPGWFFRSIGVSP